MPEISRTAPITPAQIRALKGMVRYRQMPDSAYRAFLHAHWGVWSCKDLTRRQASDAIRLLGRPLARAPGEQPPRPPRPKRPRDATPPGVERLASPAQRRLIDALAAEVAWTRPDGFAGWLHANQGLARVATAAQAYRVIQGLKALKRRSPCRRTKKRKIRTKLKQKKH